MKRLIKSVAVRKTQSSIGKHKKYLIKRIIITNLLSISVIILTYLWMIFFLSNVSTFWELFRPQEVFEQVDTVPPVTPYLNPIPVATQEESIDISGVGSPGDKVLLFVNGSQVEETTSASDGTFAFTNIKVGIFEQEIHVISEDAAGNKSKSSYKYKIVNDTEPPEIEIITPIHNSTHRDTGHTYKVTGQTEPNSTVLVNDQLAQISPDGAFSTSIRLNEGGNNIKVVAKDQAGNETEKTVYVKFEKIN